MPRLRCQAWQWDCPIPVKPTFLDIALNYMEVPSEEEKKPEVVSGGGGLLGWFR